MAIKDTEWHACRYVNSPRHVSRTINLRIAEGQSPNLRVFVPGYSRSANNSLVLSEANGGIIFQVSASRPIPISPPFALAMLRICSRQYLARGDSEIAGK